MMNIRLFILFISILNNSLLFGAVLNNNITKQNILSVKFAPESYDLGYPILSQEDATTTLNLSFDLLDEEQPALAYRLIHCDANWEKSKIMTNEFLENTFNEFYIDDYQLSAGTKRLYTHYETTIKTEHLKLSGNYIVQVFPQNDSEDTWLQLRFLFSESSVKIYGTAKKSAKKQYYDTHQRLNFSVNYDKADFSSPLSNFTAVVSQNFRWDNAQTLKPLFVNNQTLKFNYIDKKNLFNGNYEFPYFDTSNITQETHRIRTLEKDEKGETHCYLYPNKEATNNYFYLKDMNGNFAIEADNVFELPTESEYVWVHFTFVSPELPQAVFVVGRFNQWQTDERYQLFYDKDLQLYHLGLLLKQGVYNYTFVSKNTDGSLHNLLGNYSETENNYYVLIYYKDERLRTDRLVGWTLMNTQE